MSRQKNREKVFEEKAKTILEYLKSDKRYDEKFLPRPFFLEFTGSPSAGKTTTIIELDKFLRRQGFRVIHPQEGAEVIRHIPRTTPLYNVRTALYALTILLDESFGHKYDIVILDRGIFDPYCWMMYWQEKNKLPEEEARLIQSFFLSRLWLDRIDAAFFMVCDAKVAMERELRIALTDKLGETTNPKSIETLAERYKTAYKVLKPNCPQLYLEDTTHWNELEMVENIASKVLDVLEEKAKQSP